MTREEEIKYASKDYVNYLLDKQEYRNENYTEDDIRQAFEKGAKWADNHSINVWHDVSDMPKTTSWILIQKDKGGYDTFKIMSNDISDSNWVITCRIFSIYKWTYISGPLPKE